MCGIVGFISAEKNFYKAQQLFCTMLLTDMVRGWDSTGVLLVPPGGGPGTIYKRAMDAATFINTDGFDNLIYGDLPTASVVIGHNRAATKGTVKDRNAHPFKHGSITLVHNGHIQNANGLLPGSQTVEVDSMVAPRMLHERGTVEGLECLRGAFSLAWYDESINSFNLARNKERPMTMAYLRNYNVMVYGSEHLMIHWILSRLGLDTDGGFFETQPGICYTFNPENPKLAPNKTPFDLAPKYGTTTGRATTSTTQTQHGSGSNGVTLDRKQGQTGASVIQGPGTTGGLTDNGYRAPGDTNGAWGTRRAALFLKHSEAVPIKERRFRGWAIGDKAIAKAMGFCSSDGTMLGQRLLMVVDSYVPYGKNQKLGEITGHRLGSSNIMRFVNMTHAEFDNLRQNRAGIWAKIVNCKKDKKTGRLINTVILTTAPQQDNLRSTIAEVRETSTPTETPVLTDGVRMLMGPGKAWIPFSIWKQKTEEGCGVCKAVIKPDDHKHVLWVRDQPICPECNTNRNLLTDLGLVERTHLLN